MRVLLPTLLFAMVMVIGTDARGKWIKRGTCGPYECNRLCCQYWFSNDGYHYGCPANHQCLPNIYALKPYWTPNTCQCQPIDTPGPSYPRYYSY